MAAAFVAVPGLLLLVRGLSRRVDPGGRLAPVPEESIAEESIADEAAQWLRERT